MPRPITLICALCCLSVLFITVITLNIEEVVVVLPARSPLLLIALNKTQLFDRYMTEMCGGGGSPPHPDLGFARVSRVVTKARHHGAVVGLEHWDTYTLDEIGGGTNLTEWDLGGDNHDDDHTNEVACLIGRNPNDAALESRMRQRLAFRRALGLARIEWTTFGERDAVETRFAWIQRHVFNGSLASLREQTRNGTPWYNHGHGPLACLTSFEAMHRFAALSYYRYGLLLETDAVPAHRFGEKFRALLRQLEGRAFDVLHLGTCAGRGFRRFAMIARNLAVPRSLPTRCFSAVLFSRRGIAKVMAAGAVMGARYRNCDHLFNDLTLTLNLTTLWAQPPLFSEESKVKVRLFCPDNK